MDDKKALVGAEIVAALKEECTDCAERHWCDSGTNGVGIYCPVQDAADLLELLTAKPPNDPLTLEELRGMDGEPVWVTPGDFWALVDADGDTITMSRGWSVDMGPVVGKAFRRKPDGGGE